MCNAGVMASTERKETKQGFEICFGVNHLGHFVLVGNLIKLKPSRIIVLTSGAHMYARSVTGLIVLCPCCAEHSR